MTLHDYFGLYDYFDFENGQPYGLHDYLGLYDYFDFENGQPYTIIPHYTIIRNPRVRSYKKRSLNKSIIPGLLNVIPGALILHFYITVGRRFTYDYERVTKNPGELPCVLRPVNSRCQPYIVVVALLCLPK